MHAVFTRPVLAPDPRTEPLPLKTKPSFSCVIAAYQVADLISEAVESLLGQTYLPLEVIVVDDGSDDDLAAALAAYGPSVTLLRREHAGAAATMNAGARAASGDYVCFIGADDVFAPERLEALGELAMARPDLDILTTDAWVAVEGRVFRRFNDETYPFPVADQRRAILERNFVFGHTAVPRERFLAVGGFDESIRWTSDWELWARMILSGSAVGSVAEPLATYRLHERSLSAQRLQQARGKLMTMGRILEHPALAPDERAEVKRRAAEVRREIEWGEAKVALLERQRDVRRRALRVLTDSEQSRTVRSRALVAALAPPLARATLARHQRRYWVGAGAARFRRS